MCCGVFTIDIVVSWRVIIYSCFLIIVSISVFLRLVGLNSQQLCVWVAFWRVSVSFR